MKPRHKTFLNETLPQELSKLTGSEDPNFGIMTAHHMVEHLVYVTKSMLKRIGEPEAEMSKSQKYFRSFLDKGCPFEYRPKEGAQVSDLRTGNINEAIGLLKGANDRLYKLFETNPEYKNYTPMTGEFNLEELEHFQYQHAKWHLYQFGLLDVFDAELMAA